MKTTIYLVGENNERNRRIFAAVKNADGIEHINTYRNLYDGELEMAVSTEFTTAEIAAVLKKYHKSINYDSMYIRLERRFA